MPSKPPVHRPNGWKPKPDRAEYHRRYDATQRQHRDLYGSAEWTALSRQHRRENPLCAHCLQEGRTSPAGVVDHITPVSVDRSRGLDPSNLQSLCHKCHAIKTQREARA